MPALRRRPAGVRIRLPDLRRGGATLLFAAGRATVVIEILGHSQIAVTMNICMHVRTRPAERLRATWPTAEEAPQ
jgi:integrase